MDIRIGEAFADPGDLTGFVGYGNGKLLLDCVLH